MQIAAILAVFASAAAVSAQQQYSYSGSPAPANKQGTSGYPQVPNKQGNGYGDAAGNSSYPDVPAKQAPSAYGYSNVQAPEKQGTSSYGDKPVPSPAKQATTGNSYGYDAPPQKESAGSYEPDCGDDVPAKNSTNGSTYVPQTYGQQQKQAADPTYGQTNNKSSGYDVNDSYSAASASSVPSLMIGAVAIAALFL